MTFFPGFKENQIMYCHFCMIDPVPQGSVSLVTPPGRRRPLIIQPKKVKTFRSEVKQFIGSTCGSSFQLIDGPVGVNLRFILRKPKSEPKRRRTWPDRRPDLDKLVRAIFDALTGSLINDDNQVVQLMTSKDYPDENYNRPGVEITVWRVTA